MHRVHLSRSFPFPLMRSAMAAAIGIACVSPVLAYTGDTLAKDANVTLKQARNAALKARPGKITDQELERETGGSGLRYSFDIRNGKITYEVGIDAKTGAILENKAEGPNPD